MHLTILAVGRLKTGPIKSLCDDYWIRLDRLKPHLSLHKLTLRELDDRKMATKEANPIGQINDHDATLWLLDETGEMIGSTRFADAITQTAARHCQNLILAIGGADGHAPALKDRADKSISFGPMVWPHMMARLMLLEQLYRAATIKGGLPYHRGSPRI